LSLYDIIKAAPRKAQTASIAATTLYSTASLIKVKWVGASAYARTANLVVADGGATIVFNYTGSTADADIFTAGSCTTNAAANNLVSEFINLVNANANWKAFPVGALWSDTMNTQLGLVAVTTVNSDAGISLVPDGSGVQADLLYTGLSFGITATKFMAGNKMRVDEPGYMGISQTKRYINCLTYIAGMITYSSAAYGVIYIYDCDDIAQTDTLVAVLKPGATTVAFSIGTMQEAMLSVPPGHRMVVRMGSTNEALTALDWMTVVGYSYSPDGVDLLP
jgi:hypothetical protein